MEWQGFNLYRNDTFAEIFSRHRGLEVHDISGNKCYLFRAPFLGAAKLKAYLYDGSEANPATEMISRARKRNAAILEIYTNRDLEGVIPADIPFRTETMGTYVIDASRGEKAILDSMSASCRRGIIKAKELGVSVGTATDAKDFREWWEIYLDTKKRGFFHTEKKPLLLELLKHPELSRLMVARVKGRMVAGIFLIVHEFPLFWLGASSKEGWEYFPNNLLHWEAIRWAIAGGYPLYDFGGAGLNKAGTNEFKRKFGGEYVKNNLYILTLDRKRAERVQKVNRLRRKLGL